MNGQQLAGHTCGELEASGGGPSSRQFGELAERGIVSRAQRRRLAELLRPEVDAHAAQEGGCGWLGRQLGARGVAYFELSGNVAGVEREFVEHAPRLSGRHEAGALFGREALACLASDRVWVSAGAASGGDWLAGFGGLAVPVHRNGGWVAGLLVRAERDRFWRDAEVALAEEVAERIWSAVERARTRVELQRTDARLQLAAHMVQAGTWDFDLVTGKNLWSESHFTLLGLEPTPNHEAEEWMWRDSVWPEDAEALYAEWTRAERERDVFRSEHRMRKRDGTPIWVRAAAQFFYDEEGRSVRFVGIFRDITEQREIERRLMRNRDTFFNLIENAPFGVYVVDSQFRLRQVSAGSQRVFRSVSPLLGRDFSEVLRTVWEEPFASEAIARFRHTLETGEAYAAPNTTEQRGDIDEVESYDWKIERLVMPDGEFGVVCYFYDITERKQAEDAVRRRTEQFETLLKQAPIGVYLVDADFRICDVNPTAMQVFRGVPDVVGRDFGDVMRVLWPEETAGELVSIFRHTLETGEPFETAERTERRADRGVVEHYEWRIDRITLPNGRHGVVCYFRDISRQVFAREAIVESEQRFRQLADSMPQIVWTAGPDGRVDYLNRRWCEFTGSRDDFGNAWNRLLHPDDVERCMEVWRCAVHDGGPYEIEYRFREHATGEYRWFLGRATAVRDARGEIVKWFGTCTDIDDQKRASDHLERVVMERTESLRDKLNELEAFSYSISHDIRGPLRSMQGFANALSEEYGDQLDETGRDYLRRIDRGAQRLDLLVRDVLAYSKLAKEDFQLQRVELRPMLEELVQSLDLGEGSVTLEGPLPAVRAHPALLSQIFSNLVGNALKFAKPGVALRVVIRAEAAGEWARVWVEDNGIGIAPAHFARIFEIFGRVHADRMYEGTGIGLAIVKKAAERLGGRVGVRSELGTGSRFWVELARAQP